MVKPPLIKNNSKKAIKIYKMLHRLTKKSRSRSKRNKQMRAHVFTMRAHVFTSREELNDALNKYYNNPRETIKTYGEINNWDVSQITDMSMLFMGTNFNEDISNWNVSNVTDMSYMFYNATNFNQPIGNWNVSNVKDMSYMFYNATSFNQPIGSWNVSNVTNMSHMFSRATNFEQSVDKWNMDNKIVTNMFQDTRFELIKTIKDDIIMLKKNTDIMFDEHDLGSNVQKYVKNNGKISNILYFVLSIRGDPLFKKEMLRYLLNMNLLKESEKNEMINGTRLCEWYLMQFKVDKNDDIYDELKPEGYEDHSPESYEEDNGTVTKKTHKNRVQPDYEIIIYMHGGFDPNQSSDMTDFPFRSLKFLVKEGCIMRTANSFTAERICEGVVDTYSHKFADNKQMKKMYLSINSNKEDDSTLGIFICDKKTRKITKLLSVENKKFVFEKNSGYSTKRIGIFDATYNLPKGFGFDGETLSSTLPSVIDFVVTTLQKFSSKILSKENINFKKCDLIVSACRGMRNATQKITQMVINTPIPRRYEEENIVNEGDLMLEDVEEENTLPDDFF